MLFKMIIKNVTSKNPGLLICINDGLSMQPGGEFGTTQSICKIIVDSRRGVILTRVFDEL